MRLRNIPRANDVIASSPLVIQDPKAQRGQWKEVFGNDHPIHIEVGMGKGRFITELARKHPEINYIGIERYTSVLLRAVEKLQGKEQAEGQEAVTAAANIPENLYFICMDATELPEVFAPEEVARIYLNFSDPWPKDRHAKRRLPSRQFLARYDQILKKDGTIEFKTDNRGLFAFKSRKDTFSKIARSPKPWLRFFTSKIIKISLNTGVLQQTPDHHIRKP